MNIYDPDLMRARAWWWRWSCLCSPLLPQTSRHQQTRRSQRWTAWRKKKSWMIQTGTYRYPPLVSPVLLIRIRIHRIHMFLGLLDPDTDPSVRGKDPNLDPDPLVRGMDPRIQIRIHPKMSAAMPHWCRQCCGSWIRCLCFDPWIRDG